MVQSNGESSAETVVQVHLKTVFPPMLSLFKRKTPRLQKYLLKEKAYG